MSDRPVVVLRRRSLVLLAALVVVLSVGGSAAVVSAGSGFSDVNFFGFDLTGIAGNYQVRFLLDMPIVDANTPGVNDGREVLFLLATDEVTPPNEVPEPSTYALIGGALVGLQMLRRRK